MEDKDRSLEDFIAFDYLSDLEKAQLLHCRPDLYGELENGELFLLTPQWLIEFEKEAGYQIKGVVKTK